MELEQVFKLQSLLCHRENEDNLMEDLKTNIHNYTTQRSMIPTPSPDLPGFISCCVDSLTSLSSFLPTPSNFMLPLANQDVLTQTLQLLFGFGVAGLCDKGVCPVGVTDHHQVESYQSCAAQRNLDLQKILLVLRPIVKDNYFGSLVLSKYLGILIAACVQILYGPNNPNRVIKQNKTPELVHKSRLVNTFLIKDYLEELLYKAPKVVSHIVSLQLPKGAAKPPTWLLAVTNDLMRLQVLRPNGVLNVTRALFEHYGDILAYEDQSFCDKVASVIIAPPRVNPGQYIRSTTEQVSVLLGELRNVKLRQQYLRLYKNMVHKLTVDYPEQTFELFWCRVFKPCVMWKSYGGGVGEEETRILFEEKEVESWVLELGSIAGLGLFHNNLSDKLNTAFLQPLLVLYHHLYRGISPLKTGLLSVIKELISASSLWVQALMEFLSVNLSEGRPVSWEHGSGGGVRLRFSLGSRSLETKGIGLSLDPNDILGGDDNVVDICIKVLKLLPLDRSDQMSNFFVKLFGELVTSDDSPEEKSDNFLDAAPDLHHFQSCLRKGLLLEQLCQNFGHKLLHNTEKTIELLKMIIIQKSRNPSFEKDEILLVSFGILSTYLREEIKLSDSDEKEIKSLIDPLSAIFNTSPNQEVAAMANDLRICIATKINLDSLPTFDQTPSTGVTETATLSDIIRDLGDPLIPSRAHAIMQLGKRFASQDPLVCQNVTQLQQIVLDNLTHADSYIFLAAIRCLSAMSWYDTQTTLDRITQEIHNTSRAEDDRAKCMEVLVNIIKITNEMLPKFECQIFSCLLRCAAHQPSELLRISSLGCLGELCKICKYGIVTNIQEILQLCEHTVLEDQSLVCKKAAIVLLANFIECQDKSLFVELEGETLRIYRLLKKVSTVVVDEEVRVRALQALNVLSNIVREFMFPKTQIKHEIKIL